MGVSDTLSKEVRGIAVLVIIIVVFSIVLLKFKSVDGGACSGAFPNFNTTSNLCYNSTGSTTAISSVGTAIDTSVSALDEPVSWIIIIVIILVVAWLMKYLNSKKSGM